MNSRVTWLSARLALALAIVASPACAPSGGNALTQEPVSVAKVLAVGASRAVWIWEKDSFEMLDHATLRSDTLAFIQRERISILYLYADAHLGRNILVAEPAKYRRFIAAMHDRGIRVYALLGSWYLNTPRYILPRKRKDAARMFGNVLAFNTASDTASRFDGVNIDIEPYLLDDWNSKKELRIAQYLDLSSEFMRMKAQARSTIPVGPAMPFWFDGIEDVTWNGRRKRMSDHVQDIYDYVAIMDYRNFASGRDGMISHATDELDYADSVGRSVVIGVETLRTKPDKVTFFGKSRTFMEGEMDVAGREFEKHASFAGYAVHHLSTYRALAGASRAD